MTSGHSFTQTDGAGPAERGTQWELTLCEVQELGNAAGFDVVGVTTASPFLNLIEPLKAYAARGATGFEHVDINLRVDPKRWMHGAKSLISVGMAYLTSEGRQLARSHPRGAKESGLHHGITSVYAYGEDYHRVMERRMKRLLELLEDKLGHSVESRLAIDTSPLVDRSVAERAGIGWVGKNCMLFVPDYGSFVFLGTMVVDVALQPADDMLEPKCGPCTQCLEACPTGALLAPGVIDATRCLSYITQMKGIIPEAYRIPMGRRVWGCDTCQWSCPENQHTGDAQHEEYLPSGELAFPDLVRILSLTNRQFNQAYGKTAAAWRGLRTWQRNALIALGNTRRPDAVAHIKPFLIHAREELRASAVWALGRIGTEEAVAAARAAFPAETSPAVIKEYAWLASRTTGGT